MYRFHFRDMSQLLLWKMSENGYKIPCQKICCTAGWCIPWTFNRFYQFHDSTHGNVYKFRLVMENVKFLKRCTKIRLSFSQPIVRKEKKHGKHTFMEIFKSICKCLLCCYVCRVQSAHMCCKLYRRFSAFGLTGKRIDIKSKDEMKSYSHFERKLFVE